MGETSCLLVFTFRHRSVSTILKYYSQEINHHTVYKTTPASLDLLILNTISDIGYNIQQKIKGTVFTKSPIIRALH